MDGFTSKKELNKKEIKSLKTISEYLGIQSEAYANRIQEVETSIELQVSEIYKGSEMDYPK